MKNAPLTSFQSSVFEFIKEYLAANGRSPTLREMAGHFGRPSGGVFTHTIKVLGRRGLIEHKRGKWRGIEIVQTPGATTEKLDRSVAARRKSRAPSRHNQGAAALAMRA